MNDQIDEYRKSHNNELQMQFQRPDIVQEIAKDRLSRFCVWYKQRSLVRRVIEECPIEKRHLRRPELRWEDCTKKDINRK